MIFGVPLFIVLFCYLTRRFAIGGFLLWYYVQIYLWSYLVLDSFFWPNNYWELSLSVWDDSLVHVMYTLSLIPPKLIVLLEMLVASITLIWRTPENLKLLRWTLVAATVINLLAILIDFTFFKDKSWLEKDTYTFLYTFIWYLYFWRSKRVKAIFIDKNWNYETILAAPILSSEEKRDS